MSIYTMADAIVVGKGIGADGIAALSLTAPPYSLLMAIGLMMGIGTSVRIGIQKGNGDDQKANEYFTTAAFVTAAASVLICLFYIIFIHQIVRFVGAEGNLVPLTYDYLKWLARFSFMILPSTFLAAVLRADGDPNRAMAGVITGGVINIALDIILVLYVQIGIGGAAIASCAGIFVQDIIFLSHFFTKKNTMKLVRPQRAAKKMNHIFQSGISSFINELANAFIVLLLNRQILKYCGTSALSVYGMISNCVVLFNSIYSGVGQAAQPLVSFAHGAGKEKDVISFRNMGLMSDVIFGIIFSAAGILFPIAVCRLFVDVTPEIAPVAGSAIPKYFLAFLPMAINVFVTYYLQSILKEKLAFVISFLRNIVLSGIGIMVFPAVFGGESLWLVIPAVEAVVLILSLTNIVRERKSTTVRNVLVKE